MREFFQSKNFFVTLICIGLTFLVVCIVQFISIISLNQKSDELNSKLDTLAQQERYYEGLYNEASSDDYSENYAKNEHNMKNENETVYKGA